MALTPQRGRGRPREPDWREGQVRQRLEAAGFKVMRGWPDFVVTRGLETFLALEVKGRAGWSTEQAAVAALLASYGLPVQGITVDEPRPASPADALAFRVTPPPLADFSLVRPRSISDNGLSGALRG